MSKSAIETPLKGGFSFDLCRRNEMLAKKAVNLPSFRKTGSIIVGLIFQIFIWGLCFVLDMVSSQLQLHCNHTRIESRVVTALTLLKQHLFNYQGYVQAALVLGGVDVPGPHLHTIYPHGSTDTLPYATMGSGSLAAMAIFESKYKEGLTRNEGIQLVFEAICSGVFNDLGIGSNVDVCVITKGHKDYLRNHLFPNPHTYISTKGYPFLKKTEVLLTKITPLNEKVEVIEGDAMEE